MENWLTILFMIIIGAGIGGFTNFLAIRMLFRPYRTLYIGKWQVPFTPGLIPKRQGELAAQIGKLVVSHLVTPESIYKKLTDETFKKEMEVLITAKLNTWLAKGLTAEDLLKNFGIANPIEEATSIIHRTVDQKYTSLKNKLLAKSISDILPEELSVSLYDRVPKMADHIIQKGADYFASKEGKEKIRVMIENFLKERGRLWQLVQMFFGEEQLAEKIQPEIMKFLHNEGTKRLLISIINEEAKKLENKQLIDYYAHVNEEKVQLFLKKSAGDLFPVESVLQKPIEELIAPYRVQFMERVVPRLLAEAGEYLAKQSQDILKRFQVEDIIKTEIESFSLKHLEELVISIAKKELVMITYLGALLGGLIGLIQGIIVLATS